MFLCIVKSACAPVRLSVCRPVRLPAWPAVRTRASRLGVSTEWTAQRLPFLSASPCTVRLPVRFTNRATALSVRFALRRPFTCPPMFLWGGGRGGPFFCVVVFVFFVGFLCEGGRVNVSRSGCTEDATQRARTCGGSCMSLEKPRWWSPFGGCQRTMLRQQCLFESIVMLCVRCTPWPVRRCAVLRMSAPRTRPAC